jgi:hypothetical protein
VFGGQRKVVKTKRFHPMRFQPSSKAAELSQKRRSSFVFFNRMDAKAIFAG